MLIPRAHAAACAFSRIENPAYAYGGSWRFVVRFRQFGYIIVAFTYLPLMARALSTTRGASLVVIRHGVIPAASAGCGRQNIEASCHV